MDYIYWYKLLFPLKKFRNYGGAHILIGTPSGLANLVESKGSAPLGGLRVLIMDDISNLINNPHHQNPLRYLIDAIFAEVSNKKMLCKVALSETCHPSEISKAEKFLGSNLSLFNPHKVDSNLLPALATGGSSAITTKETPSSSSKADKASRSRSRARSRSRSRSSSSSSRSSSRSSRSSSRSRSKSKGRKRRRSLSSDSDRPSKGDSTFTSEMLARMKREESELFKEHGAAYEVYLEVPEMHNNYEDKYERFLASYKKKYNTTNESEHMTKMWQKYWKLCIENIKSKDWKRKRRELLEKYKLEASVSQSTSLDSNKG
ncbi:hypothetical protein Avbf_11659 [Armadillidium vulgare]|nr:hypothetical protein Avbf_11659 [Armadillidium vulgare]